MKWLSDFFDPGATIYKILFRISLFLSLIATVYFVYKRETSILKDVCLPLAALMFTAGQLLRAEKNHEFDKLKYAQQRKDQYWDKRFAYYGRLNGLIEMILLFDKKDIENVILEKIPWKETRMNKIYVALNELEFEGKVLFGSSEIDKEISKIRKEFEEIRKKMSTLPNSIPNDKDAIDRFAKTWQEISSSTKKVVEEIHDKCKQIIISHLQLELNGGVF